MPEDIAQGQAKSSEVVTQPSRAQPVQQRLEDQLCGLLGQEAGPVVLFAAACMARCLKRSLRLVPPPAELITVDHGHPTVPWP